MLKSTYKHLSRVALIIASAITLPACSNFQQHYDYSTVTAEPSAIHRVLSDHDHDGVRDFGDLCITTGPNYFVDNLGCDPFREAAGNQPFTFPEQCTLLHSGSTHHE